MTTATPAKNGLYAALAAVQADLPSVAKGETANAGTYTYDYADLTAISEAILPLLGKHGLAFTAWPTLTDDGKFVLTYELGHGPSGESKTGHYPLPSTGSPQQVGSAITYGRRYCLCAVTGVAPGGDDNDAADVPAHAMDKPKVRYAGAEHERLAHQSPDELASDRGPAERVRGQLPPDAWDTAQPAPVRGSAAEEAVTRQTAAENRQHRQAEQVRGQLPEDQPGSITPPQIRILQAHLSKFFDRTERDQRLNAAAAIIGRPIKTSSDLSYTEAEKLIKELETLLAKAEGSPEEPRDILIAVMATLAGATT